MGLPPVACTGGRLKSCAYLSSPCYYCCWPLIAAARSSTVSCSGIGTWKSGGTAAPECMEAPRPGTSSLHPPACVHPAFPNVQAFGCGGRRDPVILVTSLGCLSSSSASASLTSFLSSGCSRHILTEYVECEFHASAHPKWQSCWRHARQWEHADVGLQYMQHHIKTGIRNT